MAARQFSVRHLASTITDVLNPFLIFTALYVLVALQESGLAEAALYTVLELLAAGVVAGYVFSLRRRSRVGEFWISRRVERFVPALVLLAAFVGLLAALTLLDAPNTLSDVTFLMGLASAAVAAITLFWKASAHATVAGYAAVAGPVLLGVPGAAFVIVLPLVLWSRIALGAHTPPQTLAGAVVGASFALLFV